MVVLKAKHTLHGRKLLPVMLSLRDIDIEVMDITALARLKKDHGLEKYSAEQLAEEFRNLTGEEAGDILGMAGEKDTKEALRALVHVSILYANEVGAPKASTLKRRSTESTHQDTPSGQDRQEDGTDNLGGAKDAVDSASATGEVEDRVQAVESALRDIKQNAARNQIEEAIWGETLQIEGRLKYLEGLVKDTKY
ncbi:uncharacterized protein LOC110460997 [Mizuhopecten yessoensis]|uniref:uncharacterized protein LOC110460997 n=1 Tax=Mizuhopecten yessoensis TaxID=6573 RepID=UPI000B45F0D3|nr:uncharacterized protein LOC110460997 [Mizuhopecten yessoensis]